MHIRQWIWALLLLFGILCVQIWAGSSKDGYHCDEGFSLMLASQKIELYYRVMVDNPGPMWVDGSWLKNLTTLDPIDYADYETIWRVLRIDVHPPLYYLLLHHVQHWCGGVHSPWQGIAINIGANLICLALLFSSAARLFPTSIWPRYLAPAVWGLCVFGLDFTVLIRHYSVLAMLCTLAVWIWVHWDQQRTRYGLWAPLWMACLVVGGLTHFGVFPWMAALTLLSLLHWRGYWKTQGAIILASGLGFATCLKLFPMNRSQGPPAFREDGALYAFIHGDPGKLLVNLDVFQAALFRELLYPEVLALLALALGLALRHRIRPSGRLIALAALSLGFFLFAGLTAHIPAKRYLAPCLPCICLLVSGSITLLSPRFQRIGSGLLLLALIGQALTGRLEHAYHDRPNPFLEGRQEGIIYMQTRQVEYRQWDVFQYARVGQRYLVLQNHMLYRDVAQSILKTKEVEILESSKFHLRSRHNYLPKAPEQGQANEP